MLPEIRGSQRARIAFQAVSPPLCSHVRKVGYEILQISIALYQPSVLWEFDLALRGLAGFM